MTINFSEQDEKYMKRALELAALALGRTSPNPVVGCVIVHGNEVIGEGYHHKAGTPHAEVHALKTAGERAKAATVYVTLEPCSHFGRTPPCADALIRAGVRRVVVAITDPNPLVAGRGIQRLMEAGITVEVGLLATEARSLNEAFIKSISTGLPFVVYKSALSLDGKIATENGDSRWVSNEKSREFVHHLRNIYDVIMVGSETVIRDNPALTCRLPGGRDPIRVVVDGSLRLPETAGILTSSPTALCIIATTEAAPPANLERLRQYKNVEIWQYESPRYVPLESLLRDLVKRGWTSVLLEGGGNLAGTMLEQSLVDKIEFFLAPKLVGGNGPSVLSGLHIAKMTDAIMLNNLKLSMETGDLRISGYLSQSKEK